MATKSRRKSARVAASSPRRARTQPLSRRGTRARRTAWLSTDTGTLVTWGAIGFAALLAAGLAVVLVENGALDSPQAREFQSRLKAISNSRTPHEALAWFNDRLASLRAEFQTQLARIS